MGDDLGDGIWPVRSLSRLRKDGIPYTREAAVEAQVRQLGANGEQTRRAWMALADRADSRFVREESLVYCLREYHARGDADRAWFIADLLVQRVHGHVRREIGCWRLGPDDADDCARDLFAALFESVFDRSPAFEFWEVRFWVCLDRRLWNLAQKRQQIRDGELHLADRDDAEQGAGEGLLAQIPDAGPGPEALAEYREALSLLTENERLAVYLCHVQGWPEESEKPDQPSAARTLGVTGRSVRNYLRRAEAKLRAWQQDNVALPRQGKLLKVEANGNNRKQDL